MALGKKKGKGKHSAAGAPVNTWSKQNDNQAPASPNMFGVDSPTSNWNTSSWQQIDPTVAAKQNTEAIVAKKRRNKKIKKGIALFFGVLAALLLVVYGVGCLFFSSHYYPNSSLAGMDVSMKSVDEAADMLQTASDEYKLEVKGVNGFSFTFVPEDASITMDTATVAKHAVDVYPAWRWPYEIMTTDSRDLSEAGVATYDNDNTKEYVAGAVETYNKTATKPTDATIGYSDEAGKIVVLPEKLGTTYDADAVAKAVEEAALCMKSTLDLTDAELEQPEVRDTDPRLADAAEEANGFLGADLDLMLGDTKVADLDSKQISEWITVNKNYKATLSAKKMTAWVKDLAKKCDTVGTKRTFTNPKGKKYKVSGGDYGWEIDNDKLVSVVKKSVKKAETGTLDIPCVTTADAYNGVGKPDWGKRYLEVNLKTQKAFLYDGDKVLWSSKVVTGTPDGEHDTPTGVFDINLKASPQKLIGYENGKKIYESKVTFWMPFDGNAIGFHDATWQAAFGGTRYKDGFGSHGCVNLPYDKAQKLYNIIKVGDVVVVHR